MQQFSARLIRKLIHLLTGFLILILSYVVSKDILLLLLFVGLAFSFLTFKYNTFRLLHKTPDASLGTLFYPIGVIAAYLLLYNYPVHLFRMSLMVLTLADPMASLFGQVRTAQGYFMIWRDKKSLIGMFAFAATAAVVLIIFLPGKIVDNIDFLVLTLILAIAFELISYRGSDNFTIPVGLAVFFMLAEAHELELVFLSGVLLLMTGGSYFLFRWGLLSRDGSLMAWALGIYFIGVLGHRWILPVLFFFITSVVFTRLHAVAMKKPATTIRRNIWQVLANIIWALASSILYLITRQDLFIYFFIAVVAAVTADTWASELGPIFNKRSFSLADLRWHPAGATGGISVAGTLAALAGSVLVAGFSYWLFFGMDGDPGHTTRHIQMIAILAASGFLACFADTLLGAFLEPRLPGSSFFQNTTGTSSFSPNDMVNLLGSMTAPLFFLLLWWL